VNRTHQNRFRVRSKLGGSLLLLTALFCAALLSLGGQSLVTQAGTTILKVSTTGEWTTVNTVACPTPRDTKTYRYIAEAVRCAQAGDTVLIEDNTLSVLHYEESNITVDKAITIQGQSQGGVIVFPNDATKSAFVIASNGVVIKDLTIDGDPLATGTAKALSGIITSGSGTNQYSGLQINNVLLQNTAQTAINVAVSGIGNKILGNTINTVAKVGAIVADSAWAILAKGATNSILDIENNTAITGIFAGIKVDAATSGAAGPKVYLYNNKVTLSGSSASERGIVLSATANASSAIENAIMTGGFATAPAAVGEQGIALLVQYAQGSITLQGNTITTFKHDTGIFLLSNTGTTAQKRVVVDGNNLLASGPATVAAVKGSGEGIYITDSNANLVATNTTFGLTYATLKKNSIKGFIRGIDIDGAGGATSQLLDVTIGSELDSTGSKADANTIDNSATTINDATSDWIGIRIADTSTLGTSLENATWNLTYAGAKNSRVRINFNTIKGYTNSGGGTGYGLSVDKGAVLVQNTFFSGNEKDVNVTVDSLVDMGYVRVNPTAFTNKPNEPGYTGLGISVGCNVFGAVVTGDVAANTTAQNNWNVTDGVTVDGLPLNPGTTPADLAALPACNMLGGFVWNDANKNSVIDHTNNSASSESWADITGGTTANAFDAGETWTDTPATPDGWWDPTPATAELWNNTNGAVATSREQKDTIGVTGVDVKLYKLDTTTGKYALTTAGATGKQTSKYGYYFFPNLADGTYTVTFDLDAYVATSSDPGAAAGANVPASPPAFGFTKKGLSSDPYDSGTKKGWTEPIILAGSSETGWDAGLTPLTVIKGLVWYDKNNDSIITTAATDDAPAYVTVNLLDGSGNPVLGSDGLPLSKKTTAIAAASIAADSINYSFTVEPGNYIVEVVRPKGTTTTTPTGYVFSKMLYTTAAADVAKSSATSLTGNSKARTAAFNASASGATIRNIGLRDGGKITGKAWVDGNNNGLYSTSDTPADGLKNGVTINLLDASGNPVISGTTALTTTTKNDGTNDGTYAFNELQPGEYLIQVVPPKGYLFVAKGTTVASASPLPKTGAAATGESFINDTGANKGRTDTLDIDKADAAGGTALSAATVSYADINVGLKETNIGDFIWLDSNGNGIQDTGESGIGGVKVILKTACTGTLTGPSGTGCTAVTGFADQTTSSDGSYGFSGLTDGTTYFVFFQMPSTDFVFSSKSASGSTATTDSNATLITDSSDTGYIEVAYKTADPVDTKTGWDVGAYRKNTIMGYMWNDADSNGLQGDLLTEVRVKDAVVKLWKCATSSCTISTNTLARTTTTDNNGLYEFASLEAGDYIVDFTPPDRYGFTIADIGDTSLVTDTTDLDSDAISTFPSTDYGKTKKITLVSDGTQRRDAGIYRLSSIGNLVWEDKNGNNVQEAAEVPGISGVTVTLQLKNTSWYTSTKTDAYGNYRISNLVSGTYKITFTLKSGYSFARWHVGDYQYDSDANPTNGVSETVKIGANRHTDDVDAGMYVGATLGGRVWEDLNADGIQDLNELGVGGSKVELLGCDSSGTCTSITNTTSLATGIYSFTGLLPTGTTAPLSATYRIKVTPKVGYDAFSPQDAGNPNKDTTDSDPDSTGLITVTSLLYGTTQTNWDAGTYKKVKIETRVWEDANADGFQGPDELGFAGSTVQLLFWDATTKTWSYTGTLTTGVGNATGLYTFTNLNPGGYKLQYTLPAKYNFSPKDAGLASGTNNDTVDSDVFTTTRETAVFTTTSGETESDMDAGLYQNVTLGDRIWEDVNANGIQDPNETKGVTATVKLYLKGTSTVITMTSTSSITGLYRLQNVRPGDYSLCIENLPTGYKFSPADVGTDWAKDSDVDSKGCATIALLSGDPTDAFEWDAGVYKPGVIGDFVWEDLNADGIQDAGEKGIREVNVKLYRRDATGKDQVVNATSTNSTGAYSFTVDPATYTVEFGLPTGFSFSPVGVGASDKNSAASLTTGRTNPILIKSGVITNTFWDAGLYRSGTVGNFIWEDLNYNGIQDPGEAGIAGVNVSLLSGSTVVTKTVSSSKGLYSLSAKPGSYTVVVSAPLGYTFSPAFKGSIDNDSSFVASATSPFSATAAVILKSGIVTDTVDAGLVFAEVLINGSSDVTPTLSVVEGGKTDSYKVRLSAPPSGSVAVNTNDGSKQLTLTPATLTFDATNWNQDQTVSVVAVDDKKPESLLTALITHTVTSSDLNYNNLVPANVKVEVTDNDKPVAYLLQSAASTIVGEGILDKDGFNDTYAIHLQFAPTADVLITLTPLDSQITVTPTQLTFTPSNWAKQQVVMVSAVDDSVIEGLHNSAILHTLTSSDAIFNGGYIQEPSFNTYADGNPLPVFIEDNDSKVNISPLKLHLTEGGASATYQVSLRGSPTADVTIFPFPFDQLGIVQSTGQITFTPSSLTFSPGNASISQTVTVSALDNSILEGTHAAAIFHKVVSTSAADQDFMGTTGLANGVYLLIDDNDSLVESSPTSLELAEGGPAKTYQVQLKSNDIYGPPTKNVVVSILTDGQVTLNPTKLTFTPENYGTPQTVTIAAVDDTLLEGWHEGTAFSWLSSEDSNYVQSRASLVVATIKDNDNSPDLQLAKSDGGLKAQPGRPITYTLTYTNAGHMDASGTVITEKVPAYTSFSSSGSSTGWSCENAGVAGSACSYRLGILPVKGQGKLTFTVLVTSTLPDSALYITNTANITSDAEIDGNLVDNTASLTSTISQLRILVTDEGQAVKPGGVLRYTIHYTNTGSGIAQDVKIKIFVPANATFNSSQSGPGLAALPGVWEHADGTPCANGDPAGTTCIYLVPPKGSLGPGQSGIVYFAVTVNSTLPTGVNKITIEAEISDDTTSNKGSSEDETTVQAATNVYLPFIAKNIPYTPPATPTPAPVLTPTPVTVVENPDLVVSSVSLNPAKQTFSAGEAVEISVVVTNQGKGVAAPFWVDLYLNPNTPPTAANVRWNQTCGTSNVSYCFGLAWQISQTLQAGQSVTLKSLATGNGHFDIDSSRWQGWFANGTTDLYVYADSWNPTVVYGANQETDETNNRAEIRNLVVTGTNPPAGGGSAISTTAPR